MANLSAQSHFAYTQPSIDIQRSAFDRPSNLKTTFNAGQLIPIYVDEVLPGDTWELDTSVLCRMTTPIYPVMDSAQLEYWYFFVPMRLVWDHAKQFFGESDGPWAPSVEYHIPKVTPSIGPVESGTLADYMGLPVGTVPGLSVNALPFRAYRLIWNEWFRSEPLQSPVLVSKTDTDVWANLNTILPVCKPYDYFTGCLPAPQRGDSVLIPGVTGTGSDPIPVYTGDSHSGSGVQLAYAKIDGSALTGTSYLAATSGKAITSAATSANSGSIEPINLWATPSGGSGAAGTINQLRQAFAVQRMLERDARGGGRYVEIIASHFGVRSPDARQQRPEYLGGGAIPINVEQVVQTSSTDDVTPQGNTAAYSKTVDRRRSFTYSATEHGYIIGVAAVRTRHTYQQGLNKLWTRSDRYDFYWPALAHLGEMPVKRREIYCTGSADDDLIFGYQEAWAEYRYKPDMVTGQFRHAASGGSLDPWTYAEYYNSAPILSDAWIRETAVNVDRTLAVSSSVSHQFLTDWYFSCRVHRPMPVYSIPGLVDHH